MKEELWPFELDFATDEIARRSQMLAVAPDHDPGEALAEESAARALLMSDLDAEQRATYQMLVDAGVLHA
jgi:hypothetical protein